MKRKTVKRLLCITIVSAMLVTNTGIAFATDSAEVRQAKIESVLAEAENGAVNKRAIYYDTVITVTVEGDTVYLPDQTAVNIYEFAGSFVNAEEEAAFVAEKEAEAAAAAQAQAEAEAAAQAQAEAEAAAQAQAEAEAAAAAQAEEEAKAQAEAEAAAQAEEEAKAQAEAEAAAAEAENPPVFDPGKNIIAGKALYSDQLSSDYKITFSEDFATVMQEIESEYKDKMNAESEANAVAAAQKQLEEQAQAAADAAAQEAQEAASADESATATEQTDTTANQQAAIATDPAADPSQVTVEINAAKVDENLVVKNWQDVVALYVLKQTKKGTTSYSLDQNAKADLAAAFAELNAPVVTDNVITYQNKKIEDYIAENSKELTEEEKKLPENANILSEDDKIQLRKYASVDCMILCAAATDADGFITESLGDNISAARASVVRAAYSLVGKIAYFWGGKSNVIGWDDSWGSQQIISAAGSDDSGELKLYGLDCSGYVAWTFINGFQDSGFGSNVGTSTSAQWGLSEDIAEEDAQPGDLVFLMVPSTSGINHVGVVVGRGSEGDLIVAHCNSYDDGVVVESAYGAGFRYVRRPICYGESSGDVVFQDGQEEQTAVENKKTVQLTKPNITASKAEVTVKKYEGASIVQLVTSKPTNLNSVMKHEKRIQKLTGIEKAK